jgi:hypothetical protein
VSLEKGAPFFEHERSPQPYGSTLEHLYDELSRIHLLAQAATVRWRHFIAQHKNKDYWGMIQVTHEEIEAFLKAGWLPPGDLPADLQDELHGYWGNARRKADYIEARLEANRKEGSASGLRLLRLCELYNLGLMEQDVLLTCLLPELDSRYRRLFGYLQDDASRTQPTVDLILQILHPAVYREGAGSMEWSDAPRFFDPHRPLLATPLLVVGGEDRSDEVLSMRSLRLEDRIQSFLLGRDEPDCRLQRYLTKLPAELSPIPDEKVEKHWKGLSAWLTALPGRCAVVFLHGPYGSQRRARAVSATAAVEMPLMVCDVTKALQDGADWARLVNLAYREARLAGAALYWSGCHELLSEASPPGRWDHLTVVAEKAPGLTFLESEITWEPAGRFRKIPYKYLECKPPDYLTRIHLWEHFLPHENSFAEPIRRELVRELTNDFNFTAGQIQDALVSARSLAELRGGDEGRLEIPDLYEGCRRQSGRRIVTLARRIRPRPHLSLDSVILPPANKQQLQELCRRDKNRGRLYSELGFERQLRLGKGLVALFTGTSGTGKTLAAEAMANERRVDLYQVDLSAVVSKWVGETEKHINRVFAEVEDVNAILFFDEADSLFGKRAEVKDAQDRWANMEVNYLLQRIEDYKGTVILASNLRQNMDDAFLRRIHIIVDFPFPDPDLRLQIYQQVFPTNVSVPHEEELRELARRFRLSGGSIKNTAVDAAFRALAAGRLDEQRRLVVWVEDLVLATAREYQKMGKPILPAEFGVRYYNCVYEKILMKRNKPEIAA